MKLRPPSLDELTEAAVAYARLGYRPIPLRGKVPLINFATTDAHLVTSDPETVELLFRDARSKFDQPANRIALVMGEGVFALDFDRNHGDGADGEIEFARHFPGVALPETSEQTTPRGGVHRVYRSPFGMKIACKGIVVGEKDNGRLLYMRGLDVKGFNGLLTCAPSRREDGAYVWTRPLVEPKALPYAPKFILDKVKDVPPVACAPPKIFVGTEHPWAMKTFDDHIARLSGMSAPGRHDALYASARTLGEYVAGGYLPRGKTAQALYHAAQSCGLVGDDGKPNVLRTIEDGLDKGNGKPKKLPAAEDLARIEFFAKKKRERLERQAAAQRGFNPRRANPS